jgi:hypothetical protein
MRRTDGRRYRFLLEPPAQRHVFFRLFLAWMDAMAAEKIGFELNGPGRAYFDNVVTDNMLDALLELSAAVWSVRDRQIVLEKVLAEQGIQVSELIEQHMPDEAELEMRRAERDALAQSLLRSFLRRPTLDASMSPDTPSLREIKE